MDQTRALLDELMGEDRDGDRIKLRRNLTDKDVCHFYLCGMCPFEEFMRTKHDFGPCPHIHDDDLKAEWDALDDKSKDRLGFERELYKWIDKLMLELKAKIRRNEERLAADMATPLVSSDDQKQLDAMADELQEMLTRSQVLGEQGDVDGAQAAAVQAEAIKARRDAFEKDAAAKSGINRYGQQEVCPFSGVIVNKEESRMRDHQNGRNYRAWCKAHEKYKELKETLERRETERAGRSRDRQSERGSSKEAGHDRHRRDRDRDRDRGHDRDRGNDRDTGRSRHRDRSRDRQRDVERRRKRERDELFEAGSRRDSERHRDGGSREARRDNGH